MASTTVITDRTVDTTAGDADVLVRQTPEGEYRSRMTVTREREGETFQDRWVVGITEGDTALLLATNTGNTRQSSAVPEWLTSLLEGDMRLEVAG